MAELKQIAETLVNLTVKEVNELATILKDEYGIEPAAAAAVMVAGGGGAAATITAIGSYPFATYGLFTAIAGIAGLNGGGTSAINNQSSSILFKSIYKLYLLGF